MPKRLKRCTAACLAWIAASVAAPVSAQTPRDARVLVTVVDPSNAVVPEATVAIVGLETATKAAIPPTAKTNASGLATLEGLTPGRYSISAEFPGFELGLVRDVRLRAGDNRHVVVLPLGTFQDSASVGGVTQQAASTRAGNAFGVQLSGDQIAALSDDPNEAVQQINDLAGPNAIVRIDSFEGQQLPPKSQIKSIHITRDQFAAETEQPGSTFVDIITQPGIGPIRGGGSFSLRDGGLSARNPFAPAVGPEAFRNYAFNVGGALIKGKSNFSLSTNGRSEYSTPLLNANLPDGSATGAHTEQVMDLQQPHTLNVVSGLLDYALTKDQTLRVGYTRIEDEQHNQNTGGYNIAERAEDFHQVGNTVRILEAGPIGRRSFINTRLTINRNSFSTQSAIEAPAIIVQDAFSSGGAEQRGGVNVTNMILATDVDHVRGIHSWRAGAQINAFRADSTQDNNYLGTYVFANMAGYNAGTPIAFTRQVGDPRVSYSTAMNAAYVQDDVRLNKTLTLSPGIRYSWQTKVSDKSAFGPRFGVTWAPFKSGSTTIRASAGIFSGWLPPFVIEQDTRFDGAHEQEFTVSNPAYPATALGAATPGNKYVLGDFKLQRNIRYSAGVDRTFSPHLRANFLYNYLHQLHQMRGDNLNPIVDGVRADPAFGNIIATVTDTEIRRHEFYVNVMWNLAAPGPGLSRDLVNWKRVNIAAGWSRISARNNSNGPFSPPPTGNLADDYGYGPADMPYRLNVQFNSNQVRPLAINLTWNASDGFPYNWTTGSDDNHDGLVDDRPAGVGLRTLRTTPQSTLNARATYTFARAGAGAAAGDAQPRYRLGLYVAVSNITNHPNYAGFSGVQASPNFEKPTTIQNPRKIDFGININF